MRIFLFLLFFFAAGNLQAQIVYKTPSGKKYHLESCRMVKNVSEAVDLKAAVERGLGPCSICGPVSLPAASSAPGKAQGEARSTKQCRGYTKKRLTLQAHDQHRQWLLLPAPAVRVF